MSEQAKIQIKDLVMLAMGVLITISGYLIHSSQMEMKNSVNQLLNFQREQIRTMESIKGELKLLYHQDKIFDERIKRGGL